METVRLYNNIAATLHYEQQVIVSEDGHMDVPAALVPRLLQAGWSREPQAPVDDLVRIAASEDVAVEGGEAIT